MPVYITANSDLLKAPILEVRRRWRSALDESARCRAANLKITAKSLDEHARYCMAVLCSRDEGERKTYKHVYGSDALSELLELLENKKQ